MNGPIILGDNLGQLLPNKVLRQSLSHQQVMFWRMVSFILAANPILAEQVFTTGMEHNGQKLASSLPAVEPVIMPV